jgi:hydroxyacylglutathione hydrolase
VLFTQFVDDDLGCASYLVGDESAGECVLVDPAYAIEQYVDEAERRGARIVAALETHNHADHVSGHGRLALELGVPIRIHADAGVTYPHEPFADGDEIAVGDVTVLVVHTPGHRPEHCCFEVIDHSRAAEPWLVLTGDSLLVGDAARPDLAVCADEGASDLYRSLRRLLALSDGVEVYPGHVAGSLCGAAMSSKASTTIGFERRFNHAVGVATEQDFVAESAAIRTPRPPNMERIVALNRGPLVPRPHALDAVETAAGATALDVRPAAEFVRAHPHGAFNVPLDGPSFATKAAFILTPDERIVLHGSSRDQVDRAARSLRAVGFLELAGYLEHAGDCEGLEPVEVDELAALLERDEIELVDVREKDERDGGYIPGSRNIPYRLIRRCADELRGPTPVATICESGARASIAASILAAEGINARPVLNGGIPAWEALGKKTVAFRRCGS